MKYIIYCRKSSESEDRQVLSIPSQISELKELGNKMGADIVEILEESQSAKAPGRPIFNEMIQKIHEGKADGILAWKLDRLARNPVDGGQIQWMLQNGVISHILTPEREYKTGDNVLMMSVELGMANQYIIDLRHAVKRGNRERAKRGYPNYIPPLGYINDTKEKTIVKDNDRFGLVRKMWDLALTGNYSIPEIHRIANKDWGFITPKRKRLGGKAMCLNTLYKMFSNPFYYGVFIQNGEEYSGNFPSMVSKEEFDKVQLIFNTKGARKPQTHEFSYTGLAKCGTCGCQITAEEKTKYYPKTNNVRHYVYYRCSKRKGDADCKEKALTLAEFESQIDGVLSALTISEEFKEWALKYLGELNEKEIQDRGDIYKNLQKTYNKKQSEIDALTKMRYRDLIDDNEYLREKKKLLGELASLKSKMNGTEDRAKEWLELTEKVFIFARYARYWFENGTKQEKREIAQAIGLNFVLKDKKLTFSIQKPFQIIIEGSSNSQWWAR